MKPSACVDVLSDRAIAQRVDKALKGLQTESE